MGGVTLGQVVLGEESRLTEQTIEEQASKQHFSLASALVPALVLV